jgi:hypothetical protein
MQNSGTPTAVASSTFAAGIAVNNAGHRHPRLMEAVATQAEAFTHTCFHVAPFEGYVRLAERLNAATPGDFGKKTMLATTGAEAVENAVKMARAYTGRSGVIAFSGAFHGRTLMGMGRNSACAGQAAAARDRGLRKETVDPSIFAEMGEMGLLGVTVPEEYGGAGAVLRLLRPGRARGRARRQRLPLDDERAVVAGDVSDPCLRLGRAAQEIPAEAGLGEWIGCFGLTEPDAGSDPGGMKTRAEKTDGGYG